MASSGYQGFNGNRPLTLSGGYSDPRVATPGPGRPDTGNAKLVHNLMAGLQSWDFHGPTIARMLLSLPSPLQIRLADIVLPVVRAWAGMPFDPTDPMREVHDAARSLAR